MKLREVLLVTLLALTVRTASAQGCSDAGVCTAGPMGQIAAHRDSTVREPRHFARLMFSYAVGEQDVVIVQVQPEIGFGLTERLLLQLKMPYVTTSGDLGQNSGVGDLVATLSYAFINQRTHNLTATAGLRVPTGKTSPAPIEHTSFGPDFKPLPMPYQTGLGTLDLLLGVQYRTGRWTGALAYQHVLDQGNENLFLHRFWEGNEDALGYFESFYLERANDAVARVQCAIPYKRLTIQPGLLAIYHLGLDTRLEEVGEEIDWGIYEIERKEVEGSDGLTLNITADARYALSDAWALEVAFGSPVIVREVRPDGLTRHFVLSVGARFAF